LRIYLNNKIEQYLTDIFLFCSGQEWIKTNQNNQNVKSRDSALRHLYFLRLYPNKNGYSHRIENPQSEL